MGDADADTDDTLKWIKRAKKKEKELAKKRQQELEEMDRQLQGEEYTESESYTIVALHNLTVRLQRTSKA